MIDIFNENGFSADGFDELMEKQKKNQSQEIQTTGNDEESKPMKEMSVNEIQNLLDYSIKAAIDNYLEKLVQKKLEELGKDI